MAFTKRNAQGEDRGGRGGGEGGVVTRKFEFFPREIHEEIVMEPLVFNNKLMKSRGEKIAAKVQFIHIEHKSLII